MERGDGLTVAIQTLRDKRPHVPYTVVLLEASNASESRGGTRVGNVKSFVEALQLAQAPADELAGVRAKACAAYEDFKRAAGSALPALLRGGAR